MPEFLEMKPALRPGSKVTFKIDGYLVEMNSSDMFTFYVPNYPRRIDKSSTIFFDEGPTFYQPISTTSTYDITMYRVSKIDNVTGTGTSGHMNLIVKCSVPPSTININDNVQFTFNDPGIGHLNTKNVPVTNVNRTYNTLVFKLPTASLSPLVDGSIDTSLTGINRVVEVTNTPRAKQFTMSIDDRAIYNFLEKTSYVIQIPIYAFSQKDTDSFSVNDPKYVFLPGRSFKTAPYLISNTAPPSFSTASALLEPILGAPAGKYGYPRRRVTSRIGDMTNNGKYFRFWMAIAEYTKDGDSAPWVGKWLQLNTRNAPIWKQVGRRPPRR